MKVPTTTLRPRFRRPSLPRILQIAIGLGLLVLGASPIMMKRASAAHPATRAALPR